ncbi:HET-domain-containing protein [Hypoxylon sp. FL1857]|nr:HET-domain-containing protein [Hypoxylon sp. FL1857]
MSHSDPYIMSGAIRPHGKKTQPPISAGSLGQQDDLVEYFTRRKEAIAQGTRRTFSINEPHGCVKCQKISINSDTFEIPDAFCLSDHLSDAVEMAIDGCAFYEWLVDLLVPDSDDPQDEKPFLGASSSDITFYIELNTRRKPNPYMLFQISAELIAGDGEYTTHTLFRGSPEVWTTEDNLAAPCIRHRPFELDKASRRTMRFIHDCLQTCRASHTECRYMKGEAPHANSEIIPVSELPTRLLQIAPDGQSAKLVVTQDLPDVAQQNISHQGYASLSYCWGGPQLLRLTADTFNEFTDGVKIDRLPQTLLDALRVTQELDLSHIWIDSLCIFQDNPSDLELEIARMPLYYSANTVTISADSAAACTEGFLGRGSTEFAAGPFEITFTTPFGPGSIQLFKESSEKPIAPISRRGWTFQESMLSRRMVAFGEIQAVWCCNVASTGCGGISADIDSDDRSLNVAGNSVTMASMLQYSFEDAWDMMVQEFMGRTLGVESDKLLAIGALASRMADVALERKFSRCYLAGLFVNTASVVSWARQLLWLVDPQTARRPQKYRSPSWSWAAVDGHWSHLHVFLPPSYHLRYYNFSFKVTDFKVELNYPKAPYGSVRSAWLEVTGFARRMNGIPQANVIFPPLSKTRLPKGKRTVADLLLFCDTAADRAQVESALQGCLTDGNIFLLEIIPPYLARDTPSVGLILFDKYRSEIEMSRIGAYVFYFTNNETGIQAYEQFYDGVLEACRIV